MKWLDASFQLVCVALFALHSVSNMSISSDNSAKEIPNTRHASSCHWVAPTPHLSEKFFVSRAREGEISL